LQPCLKGRFAITVKHAAGASRVNRNGRLSSRLAHPETHIKDSVMALTQALRGRPERAGQ